MITKIYMNKQDASVVRLTAAAILLKDGSDKGLQYIKQKSGSSEIKERIQSARILALVPSIQGIKILEKMLDAENPLVKDQENASAQNADIKVLKEVIEALTSINLPEGIEPLRKLAMNGEECMSFRLKAIAALGQIEQEEVIPILLDLMDNENGIIQYKTLITIGKIKSYEYFSPGLKERTINRLEKELINLEDRKATWRKIRDEKTDSYNERQLEYWRRRLNEYEPREAREFEVAFVMGRLDPGNHGIKFLGHHLANVREGAWMALGKSKDVSLLKKLYELHKQSPTPWLRHAAYRAIDNILVNIEISGSKEESKKLEDLRQTLINEEGEKKIHPGVKTRLEWTIERLAEFSKNP